MKANRASLWIVLGIGFLWPGTSFSQGYNSVIITEIMADPTPVVGLPDAEYIEIFNRSLQPVSTKGWRLGTALLPDSVLAPGSHAILCSRNSAPLLSRFGRVWGLSTFSLANAGATLTLRNAKGTLVFSIAYKDTWWPSNRRNGGYALEMVDVANPCGENDNWRPSTDPLGGTPNKPNSVTASNPDRNSPVAERVEISGESQVTVYFNERLDSLASSQTGIYELKGRSIRRSVIEAPGFRTSLLTPDAPLLAGQRYELSVGNVTDCAGNRLKETTFVFGLPVTADSGDVILNEIMFDPRTGGVEFAEIHNRSPNFISLKDWSLGNVRAGVPGSFKTIATRDLLLAPNEFMAFSVNSTVLAGQYPTERSRTLLTLPSMPSFVNEIGGVALRDATGKLVDVFEYKEKDQSPLVTNAKGVSLERIYPERPGNDPRNWQSAAAVVGYATPGYANSQGAGRASNDDFVIEPEAITPNGDGIDDFASIRYSLNGPGRVASVRIFDLQGRLVRNLVRNQTIGTDGSLRWEGQNDRGEIVRTGYYLIMIDSFDSAGNTQQFKKKVVVVQP
ncbi:lamin tail domain-containing protein [Persicitalea jodogahamensis]|uniref:lamin tail domain-containing protein n=1 Tax=Persicitalea jodogahamensis TaxID=402147 RepID=UPI001673A918|nr:lamin tail domain-containing protein [Persicitalea jodogahamensis]